MTNQEIFNALMDLDFHMLDVSKPFFHDDIDVMMLVEGASKIIASSPTRGQFQITVMSVQQLEVQLVTHLGYKRTEGGFF